MTAWSLSEKGNSHAAFPADEKEIVPLEEFERDVGERLRPLGADEQVFHVVRAAPSFARLIAREDEDVSQAIHEIPEREGITVRTSAE